MTVNFPRYCDALNSSLSSGEYVTKGTHGSSSDQLFFTFIILSQQVTQSV